MFMFWRIFSHISPISCALSRDLTTSDNVWQFLTSIAVSCVTLIITVLLKRYRYSVCGTCTAHLREYVSVTTLGAPKLFSRRWDASITRPGQRISWIVRMRCEKSVRRPDCCNIRALCEIMQAAPAPHRLCFRTASPKIQAVLPF